MRVTSNNLDVLLDAEKHNSNGEVESKMAQLRKPRKKSKSKSKHATQRVHVEEDTDKEDSNFTTVFDRSHVHHGSPVQYTFFEAFLYGFMRFFL